MPYEDAFADLLTKRGVPLSAEAVPSKEAVDADLESLASWLKSLEPDTHLAMDEVTGENAIQAGRTCSRLASRCARRRSRSTTPPPAS